VIRVALILAFSGWCVRAAPGGAAGADPLSGRASLPPVDTSLLFPAFTFGSLADSALDSVLAAPGDAPSGYGAPANALPANYRASPEADSPPAGKALTLEEAIDRLLRFNPEIAKARQAWFAANDRFRGSFGLFEPALTGSWDYQSSDRPYVLAGQRQNVYAGGVEGTLPTATKYNFGFNFTDLDNKFVENVTLPSAFTGVTVTQPILQGLWFGKPIADILAARAAQKSALHHYRSILCASLAEARSAYWKLRYAQDKAAFAGQSVEMAMEMVADSRLKFRAGKASQVDTIEAAAGLASRLAALAAARTDRNGANSELKLMLWGDGDSLEAPIEAATPLQAPGRAYLDSLAAQLDMSRIIERQPDYLEKKYETARQKVAYNAQYDQCLPELTLKGSWGYQVTGNTSALVWNRFTNDRYLFNSPTYSAGVQLRMPLGLNLKERGSLVAQGRTVRQAEIDERTTRNQLQDYVRVSLKRLQALRSNIDNAGIVVDYRLTLLNAEIKRQAVGKSDYHKIFEMEEERTKAKVSEMDNTVEFLVTQAQLQRFTGSALADLGLESFRDGTPLLDARLTGETPRKP
jgi:outer membrane protein TolC